MGLVIAAGEGDSHDSSSVILWDSYIVAFCHTHDAVPI
jgi:hypothetical protein